MKKLAGIILLTAAVILTAGCISATDSVVGTWSLTEPVILGDYTYTYTLTFNEDGSGQAVYTYSDEPRDRIYPLVWEKTGEDTYWYEYIECLTLSDDKKSLTDFGGYEFTLGEGEEIIGGTWTETKQDEIGNTGTYVFMEDGTCTLTLSSETEEQITVEYRWSMPTKNQIAIHAYYYPYTITEDKIVIIDEGEDIIFEKINGEWIENPTYGDLRSKLQFLDDGTCIETSYIGETDEVYGTLYWYWEAEEDGKSGILIQRYTEEVMIQEDGTLINTGMVKY